MSAIIQHGHHDHGITHHDHAAVQFIKSAAASAVVLAPSLMTGLYLLDHLHAPFYSAPQIVCLILLLASVSLVTVIIIDAHRHLFSRATPAALISMISMVILFVVTESFNRFVDNHIGYSLLTPVVIGCIGLIYTAVIFEKNILMKSFLSLNSIGVMFLWALGSVDKFDMPF